MNTIINKLREVLGATASNPRFIETLAKRGYRFRLPVESISNHRSPGDATQAVGNNKQRLAGELHNNEGKKGDLSAA